MWAKLKRTYDTLLRKPEPPKNETAWSDTDGINLLAIAVSKLTDLAMTEAVFSVATDTAQAEEIKDLCADLQDRRFALTSAMLGEGDCIIFPAMAADGRIIHTVADADHFRITDTDGEKVTEIIGVLDEYAGSDGKRYKLVRRHKLDANGTLRVEVYTVNDKWEPVVYEPWKPFEMDVVYEGAEHIGVGRYKSPVAARGDKSIYGKPLNYGCGDIEARILQDIENRDNEMTNGKSILFADERIIDRAKETGKNTISENVFGMRPLSGSGAASNIDIYNPTLRIREYNEKLAADLELYEMQLGLSKGILSDAEPTNSATATEINVSNASTVAMINAIQSAIDVGNIETLKADSVFIGVPFDLWHYSSDYYNPFDNPDAQFSRLLSAVDIGAADRADVTSWLFPHMSRDEIAAKLAEIDAARAAASAAAVERAMQGAWNE